jgi:hypothetical protein
MRFSMFTQAARCGETSPAIHTLVRLLPGVGPRMRVHVVLPRETPPTQIALVRLLPGVGPRMRDHVALPRETSPT